MKLLSKGDLRAAFLASFISGPVFWLGHCIFYPSDIINDPWWVIPIGAVFWQAFTYPISLVGLFLAGLPCHALLRLIGAHSYIVIGLLGAPLVVLLTGFGMSEGEYDQITILFISCGAAVSALYAALSKKFNKAINFAPSAPDALTRAGY
tara:strand:- start:1070 stop:1519 length:450 start_codon:yes stop_codon:yes gene_type:complete